MHSCVLFCDMFAFFLHLFELVCVPCLAFFTPPFVRYFAPFVYCLHLVLLNFVFLCIFCYLARCAKTRASCFLSQTLTSVLESGQGREKKTTGHNRGRIWSLTVTSARTPCPVSATCDHRLWGWAPHVGLASYRLTHSLQILSLSQVCQRHSGSRHVV